MKLHHQLIIDYQYQSFNRYRLVSIDIDWYRLISIVIDYRFYRLDTPGLKTQLATAVAYPGLPMI